MTEIEALEPSEVGQESEIDLDRRQYGEPADAYAKLAKTAEARPLDRLDELFDDGRRGLGAIGHHREHLQVLRQAESGWDPALSIVVQ